MFSLGAKSLARLLFSMLGILLINSFQITRERKYLIKTLNWSSLSPQVSLILFPLMLSRHGGFYGILPATLSATHDHNQVVFRQEPRTTFVSDLTWRIQAVGKRDVSLLGSIVFRLLKGQRESREATHDDGRCSARRNLQEQFFRLRMHKARPDRECSFTICRPDRGSSCWLRC